MKNILITGGAGFIGSHLVDRLLSEGGFGITVVDDFNDFYDPAIKHENIRAALSNPNFKLVEADIRNQSASNRLWTLPPSTASCISRREPASGRH